MADPLTELKKDLAVLAAPGSGKVEPVLEVVKELFEQLENVEVIGTVLKALAEAIDTGFEEAGKALKALAEQVEKLEKTPGGATLTPAEVKTGLTGLQNSLSTAATLIPGSSSAVAKLPSGGQFFELLAKLLENVQSFKTAGTLLREIGEQLETIGKTLKP